MFKQFVVTKGNGKCSGCSIDLKQNWKYYYDDETKVALCTNCYAKKQREINTENNQVVVPENINETAKIDDIILSISHFNTHLQVIHVDLKSMNEKLISLQSLLSSKESKKTKQKDKPTAIPADK